MSEDRWPQDAVRRPPPARVLAKLVKFPQDEIKPLSLEASTPPPPPTVASVSSYDAQATFHLVSPSSRFIDAHVFPNFFPEG